MRYLRAFTTGLAALALCSTAWAEIYETKDAAGNPEFTDSPVDDSSNVIDLSKTNIADAPPSVPQQEPRSETKTVEQAPAGEHSTVIINNTNDEVYEERLRREREEARRHSATPHEVGDTDSQMPHEVGDSDSQIPHEVGDFPEETPGNIENIPESERVRHSVEKGGVHRRVHRGR